MKMHWPYGYFFSFQTITSVISIFHLCVFNNFVPQRLALLKCKDSVRVCVWQLAVDRAALSNAIIAIAAEAGDGVTLRSIQDIPFCCDWAKIKQLRLHKCGPHMN